MKKIIGVLLLLAGIGQLEAAMELKPVRAPQGMVMAKNEETDNITAAEIAGLSLDLLIFVKQLNKNINKVKLQMGVASKKLKDAQAATKTILGGLANPASPADMKYRSMAQVLEIMLEPLSQTDTFIKMVSDDVVVPFLDIVGQVPAVRKKTTFASGKTFNDYTKENIQLFNDFIEIFTLIIPEVAKTLNKKADETAAAIQAGEVVEQVPTIPIDDLPADFQ